MAPAPQPSSASSPESAASATSEPSVHPTLPTFDEVYAAHVDYVWRLIARLGVPARAVPDVAQDAFVVVHKKLPEFEGRSAVRTWLFQIVRNVVHDYRRTVRRRDQPVEQDDDEVARARASEDQGPDARAARAQAVRILHELLDKLDDDKREVFVLADLEQIPAAQIAEAIGANVNTIYSRLRLAREAFNRELARYQSRERSQR